MVRCGEEDVSFHRPVDAVILSAFNYCCLLGLVCPLPRQLLQLFERWSMIPVQRIAMDAYLQALQAKLTC